MKTPINSKTILFLIILLISVKVSNAQVKKTEAPENLILPDSYYKGQEEKRKYAESHKPGSVSTMTVATIQPQQSKKKEEDVNPEIEAKSMLNTTNIPVDFPVYNSASMSERDYEGAVYKWFKANPSFRKINK